MKSGTNNHLAPLLLRYRSIHFDKRAEAGALQPLLADKFHSWRQTVVVYWQQFTVGAQWDGSVHDYLQ